jgi:hypothetical protein
MNLACHDLIVNYCPLAWHSLPSEPAVKGKTAVLEFVGGTANWHHFMLTTAVEDNEPIIAGSDGFEAVAIA